MVIRRVNPFSVAKIAGVLYALMGLLIGLVISLVFMVAGGSLWTQQDAAGPAGFMLGMGAGAVIAMPIFYGVLGFVTTLIAAVFYNVVAGMVGGIEIDVEGVPAAGGGTTPGSSGLP